MKNQFFRFKKLILPTSLSFIFLIHQNASAQNVSTNTLSSEIRLYAPLVSPTNADGLTNTGDDQISNAITLPFPFTFGGKEYTQIKISSNGWLTFNENVTNSYPVNDLSNAMLAKPMIMPLWDDLQNRTIPSYKIDGIGANRIFKIQWSQSEWSKSANGDVISFQVWLYENGNSIEFFYSQGLTAVNAGSATVGLFDNDATMFTLNSATFTSASASAPAISSANSICHTSFTTNSTLNAKPAAGRVFKFTPTALSLNDRWWVHVYDNNVVNVNSVERYVGYYSFTTSTANAPYNSNTPSVPATNTPYEGFKTNNGVTNGFHGWPTTGSPTDATGYIGCPTTTKTFNGNSFDKDQRYKYHFRRDALDCGFYKVTMQMLDDSAGLYINDVYRWGKELFHTVSGNVLCANGCNNEIGYLYLDENSKIELKVKENTGFTGAWMVIQKLNATYATDVIDNNNQPLCLGNSVVTMTGSTPAITAVGLTGSLLNPQDVPWQYKWERSVDGVSNWTVITGEEGESLSPGISNTSMYYRRKTVLCDIDAGTSSFAQIIYPGTGNEFGQNGDQKTCVVNTNDWVHFFHNPGGGAQPRLLASIHSGGQNLGNVTVTSYVGATADVPACLDLNNPLYFTSVLDRHWVITPQFQPSSSVKVRLPFRNAELSTLVVKSGQNLSAFDNVATVTDLKLSKYSGPNNVDANARNNCADQGGSQNTQSNFASPANGNTIAYSANPVINVPAGKYKDFTIPGFSEFWLHGQSNNSPLPVELIHFSSQCISDVKVVVQWSTASESNSLKFRVEKSRDLQSWFYVDERTAAGNSSYQIDYEITVLDQSGLIYYRLIQIDQNGNEKIYGPISNLCGHKGNEIMVFPNPVNGQFTVEILSEDNTDAIFEITDVSGKIISRRILNILKGENQLFFDSLNLAQGSYFLKLSSDNVQFKTIQLVVDN